MANIVNQINVYLSGGHSTDPNEDRGASGNGLIEGIEAYKLARDVQNTLSRTYTKGKVVLDKEDTILKETLAAFSRLVFLPDLAIEFHFNASDNLKATGVEVLIPDVYGVVEKRVATKLAETMSQTMLLASRGVKTEAQSARGKLGWMRMNCNNILIEVCFLSNANDVSAYKKSYNRLVQAIVDVINTDPLK